MEYEEPLFFHVIQYAAGADRDVVNMVSGNPDWEPPAALREGLRAYADGDAASFQYPPSEGLRNLREEIAARRGVDESRVIVTNGAGEANYLALARALERDAGEEVVLTDPVYPYYPGKVSMLGGDPRTVPVREDGSLDLDRVREAITDDTAAAVLNTPNNPTGAVYPPETVEAVAEWCAARDALLVVDEVYDHFVLDAAFESALALDADHVIVSNSFSKSMAITGFRVGYGVFPESLVDEAKTRHMLVNVTGSRPSQAAVSHALSETGPEYYEAARERLRERVATFTGALDDAGAAYTSPDGAFYVLVRFEEFPGTMANAKRLIDEAGVAGMPGEAFGEARSDWLRFALVTPRVEEAATRLADFFA